MENELEKHDVLQRKGLIAAWHDRKIVPGTIGGWMTHLGADHLFSCFIRSDFWPPTIAGESVQEAMRRHQAGEARRDFPSSYVPQTGMSPFSPNFRPFPTDGKPVSLALADDLVNVALGIRRAIDEWHHSRPDQFLHETAPDPTHAIQEPIWTIPFRRNPFFTGREEVFTTSCAFAEYPDGCLVPTSGYEQIGGHRQNSDRNRICLSTQRRIPR